MSRVTVGTTDDTVFMLKISAGSVVAFRSIRPNLFTFPAFRLTFGFDSIHPTCHNVDYLLPRVFPTFPLHKKNAATEAVLFHRVSLLSAHFRSIPFTTNPRQTRVERAAISVYKQTFRPWRDTSRVHSCQVQHIFGNRSLARLAYPGEVRLLPTFCRTPLSVEF